MKANMLQQYSEPSRIAACDAFSGVASNGERSLPGKSFAMAAFFSLSHCRGRATLVGCGSLELIADEHGRANKTVRMLQLEAKKQVVA